MLNARSAQEDINKDAYIKKLENELNTVKSENQKLERELKEIKMDVSGTKEVLRRSGVETEGYIITNVFYSLKYL